MAWLSFLPYMQFQFVNTILEVINLLTRSVSCTGCLLQTPERMISTTTFSFQKESFICPVVWTVHEPCGGLIPVT
jgi:hypothetical protein